MTRCCARSIEAHGGWLFKHTGDGVCAAFGSARAAIDAAVEAQQTLALPVRMGVATGEAERRGDDYLRAGVEPHGAGDGRRSRRPDPGGGVDGGGGVGGRAGRSGRASAAGPVGGRAPVPGARRRVAGRVPAVADVGRGAGEPAGADDEFRGPRGRGEGAGRAGAGPSAGDADRGGRGGQDPPGGPGRGRAGRRVPRRGVAGRVGPGRRPGRGARRGGRRVGRHPAGRAVGDRQRRPGACRGGGCWSCWTTASTSWTPPPTWSKTILAHTDDGEGDGDLAGRGCGWRPSSLWPVPSLDVADGVGVGGGGVVRRTGPGGERPTSRWTTRPSRRRWSRSVGGLDGIALAIELAAARMVSMSAERCARPSRRPVPAAVGVAARVGTPPDAAPRGAVVLRPARRRRTRRCLCGCSVFAGGFDLAAAAAICGRRSTSTRCWTCWIRWCASRWSPSSACDGHARYGMLETIRQFAEEQLAATGTIDEVRDRHARYFAEQAVAHWDVWDGPGYRRRGRLGGGRVRQPARRVPLGRRSRRPRHRDGDRRPHHDARFLRAALRAGRLGRRDPRRGHRRRRGTTPAPLHRRRHLLLHRVRRIGRKSRPHRGDLGRRSPQQRLQHVGQNRRGQRPPRYRSR